jgi:hypothetical protein
MQQMQDILISPPPFLKIGNNKIRLRVTGGTGDTTSISWDQIICQISPFSIVWMLGNNDENNNEFAQNSYKINFEIAKEPVSNFPKEINTTWYKEQKITFHLTQKQCQKAAVLSLDIFWNDGFGSLKIKVEQYNGKKWINMGIMNIGKDDPKTMIIPAYLLKEGVNEWRFVSLSGNNETTIVVFDSISLYQRKSLPYPISSLLDEILDTTLKYFLSPRVVPISGLPLTALKVTDRARFGYSNPTEWGYTLQAWIIAAERGLITPNMANYKIKNMLKTILKLQNNPEQFKHGLFYPYYKVIDAQGKDIIEPYHDGFNWLPSGDCALLYGSLNVTEGWLLLNDYTSAVNYIRKIKQKLNFRSCYFETSPDRAYMSLIINANTKQLSPYSWYVYADEGGVVGFLAYLSNSITFKEWCKILSSQDRSPRSWKNHYIKEAAYFNAMFTWAQRSLIGFPMFGSLKERIYGIESFLPNIAAHLDYGNYLQIDYPAFSDAMTQTYKNQPLVAHYTPPNLVNIVPATPPQFITPHALAVPFCGLDTLDEKILKKLFEKLLLLKCDTSGVWHPIGSKNPFGFEVVASPFINQTDFNGTDDGRYIFETLSQAYMALPIFEGLQRYGKKRTFYFFASHLPDYILEIKKILDYAYPIKE